MSLPAFTYSKCARGGHGVGYVYEIKCTAGFKAVQYQCLTLWILQQQSDLVKVSWVRSVLTSVEGGLGLP